MNKLQVGFRLAWSILVTALLTVWVLGQQQMIADMQMQARIISKQTSTISKMVEIETFRICTAAAFQPDIKRPEFCPKKPKP